MSQENNNFKFNVDILMNDVNNVIQTGINNLLKDFITNYKLYEETHNCIMNLPSVKREISKMNYVDENYDDLPDLISMSSNNDSFKYDTVNYTRIPVEYESEQDSDQESDDTLLCMRKVANQLLKEKEETIYLYEKEKFFYNEIIEKCYKQIENLKNEIDELKKCIKQPLVCDLTTESSEEVIVEIKQEKENIILHIEENTDENDELEESGDEEVVDEEQDDFDEESEDEVNKTKEEEYGDVNESEENVDEEQDEVNKTKEAEESGDDEDDEEDEEDEEHEEDEEAEESGDDEEAEESEKIEENDEVETENSESDEKSQEELEEELIEIEIDDITYCTNDEDNGLIYELDKDGNVGEVVGYLKDGEPFFN